MRRWLWVVLAVSCGSAQPNPKVDPDRFAMAKPAAAPGAGDTAAAQEGTDTDSGSRIISAVTRAQLDALLDRGPAYTLAMVQTDSVVEGGRFVGFRVVAFRFDADEVLGVRPGDVVMRVNGMPIENPDQFFAVFAHLRTADHVEFSLLRDGKPHRVTTPVTP